MSPVVGVGIGVPYRSVSGALTGILPSNVITEYDAVKQGGSPQLLIYSDDPSSWTGYGGGAPDTNCNVTLAQSDPEGGSNAFKLTGTGDNATFHQHIERLGPGKLVLDVYVTTDDASKNAGVFFWSDDLDDYLLATGEIITGPGTVRGTWGGDYEVVIENLVAGQWTKVRVTSNEDVRISDLILVGLRPHNITPVLPTTDSAIFYRPTVRAGMVGGFSDGVLHASGAVAPALVTQLDDHSLNAYHQTTTPGTEPIFISNMGDSKPAWWFNGVDTQTDGVAITSEALPIYRWSSQCFVTDGVDTNQYYESGTANLTYLRKLGSRLVAVFSGVERTAGAVTPDLFQYVKARLTSTVTGLWLDGVGSEGAGVQTNPLTGIFTGSSSNGLLNMNGYIRATMTAKGAASAEEIDGQDALYARYSGYTVPVPSPPSVGAQTEFYVSSVHPSASDSNPGTSSLPWLTFDKIVTEWPNLNPGDTVHLDQGSDWTFSGDGIWWWDINDGGTPGNPITLRGDDYDSGNGVGKPVHRHTGAATVGGRTITIYASYVTIRDFTMNSNMSAFSPITMIPSGADIEQVNILNMTMEEIADYDTYSSGIAMGFSGGEDINNCLIEGNDISDYAMVGINVYSTGGGTINYCTFRNNRVYDHAIAQASSGPPAAIQTVRGGTGNIWEYNYFEDRVSPRIWLSNVDNDGASADEDVIIRYNIFKGGGPGAGSAGFVAGIGAGSNGAYNVDFYGNIIYNCANQGLYLGGSPDITSGTFKIYNNTFYDNYRNGLDWMWSQVRFNSGDWDEVIIKNNLFWIVSDRDNHASLWIESGFTPTITHGTNLFWGNRGTTSGAVRIGSTNYSVDSTSPVTDWEADAENTDPNLLNISTPPTSVSRDVDPSPTGLELGVTSPARDNGEQLGTPYNQGIAGYINAVLQHIGAYQK